MRYKPIILDSFIDAVNYIDRWTYGDMHYNLMVKEIDYDFLRNNFKPATSCGENYFSLEWSREFRDGLWIFSFRRVSYYHIIVQIDDNLKEIRFVYCGYGRFGGINISAKLKELAEKCKSYRPYKGIKDIESDLITRITEFRAKNPDFVLISKAKKVDCLCRDKKIFGFIPYTRTCEAHDIRKSLPKPI